MERDPFVVRLLMDMNPCDKAETERKLKQYGNCANGRYFIRDVVVPADITLYALHFAIQKLFGFTNSHLRRFSIPRERLLDLCDNSITFLFKFVGVFLQFDEEDSYFLEDYVDGEDFKVWLRKKYRGPYVTYHPDEDYNSLQARVRHMVKRVKPMLEEKGFEYEKMTVDQYENFFSDADFSALLMTLPLSRVLATENAQLLDAKSWREDFSTRNPMDFAPLATVLDYEYDYGDGWRIEITRPEGFRVPPEVITKAVRRYTPVCFAKDGFYLVDDVGGPDGYADFIACVYGGERSRTYDYDDPKETYDWAHRTFGWSRRDWPPESML